MYDFEKYYSDIEVAAEANIDMGGLQMENPQGNPNEHVTNNVVYYITNIALSNDPEFASYVGVGLNDRVEIIIQEGASHEEHYFAPMHPLSDLGDSGVMGGWHPGKDRERFLDLDTSYGNTVITYRLLHDGDSVSSADYTNARLFLAPRYEFVNGNGSSDIMNLVSTGSLSPLTVNQNVISDRSAGDLSTTMRAVYMMLGLNGKRKVSMKSFRKGLKSSAGRYNAVIGYDLFRKRLTQITGWCAENNYGLDVKYYDRRMSEPLPDWVEDATDEDYKKDRDRAKAKHAAYELAVINADRTRTTMERKTSFDEAYGNQLPAFLNNPRVSPLVDNLTPEGDGVTAIIPPLKDAVKGVFYPREEIENDFYENFETVYGAIKDAMAVMGRYLSAKTKRKMSRLGARYTNYRDDDGTLAFDLDSIVNALQDNYNYLLGTTGGLPDVSGYAIGNRKVPNLVTAYPRIIQINGKPDPSRGGQVSSFVAAPNPVVSLPYEYLLGFDMATDGSGYYTADNYAWNKAVISMSSEEIRELLVEAFNWVLAKEDEVPLELGSDYFTIDDNTFSDGYDSDADIDDLRVRQCKRFIEIVGGWMNLFRTYNTAEKIVDFVNGHPRDDSETIMDWLIRLSTDGLVDWNLSGSYNVIAWDTSSSTNDGVITYRRFEPSYAPEWSIDPNSPEDIDGAIGAASVMVSAYKEMRSQLVSRAFMMSSVRVVKAWLAMEDASDAIEALEDTLDRIIWYQAFVNESVFTNRSMYLDFDRWLKLGGKDDDDDYVDLPFVPWALPARFMVPVAMYRKVRKKYRRWGRTRHRTVKVYDGVRWAEVRFYDLNVFGEYPQIEETPGTTVQLGIPADIVQSGGTWFVNFESPLPEQVWNAGNGELLFDDVAGTTLQVLFDGDMSAHVPEDSGTPGIVGEHIAVSVKVPPERSRNDPENKTPVTIHLKAPGLPYDDEVRKQAFVEYGPFSQDRLFEVIRSGDGGFPGIPDSQRFDGWKVFRPTSRKIEDMREGFGLYDKVAFLISILSHEFGPSRVELINTWRSEDDQKGICTGGAESSMLSWHNYGMAAKILVYKADCTTPIEDRSDDMKHLVKVARAFTEICGDGRLGTPCNVVWCGRLTVNPSLFDWEFLPIGVGHKDAFRFREALMAQRDPLKECAYVDVDAARLVRGSAPDDGSAYVLSKSSAYRNSVVIDGHHYVSPDRIVNYRTPEDIVLYDLVEYIDLINLKLNANGNTLGDRANMYEWKSVNDSACTQLIRYFALTNNIKSAKSLIAGDFVEKYQAIEDAYYSSSTVDYVKNMLGSHYDEVYITVDSMNDAGFISLANGKMYVKTHDMVPDNVPTILDMHGQQRVDTEHIRRGVWRDGLFYGLDEIEIPYIESDNPVIEGYVGGQPSYGEAMFLHQAVASELHSAFLKIREMFERYSGPVMYDRFQDGPNASKFDQLENEFGAIAAQDLMTFDELETMLAQDDINRLADIETNGDRNGIGDGTGIYEKVVNNAQLAGMRRAVTTSERMHITDRGNGFTPGEIYRAVMEGRAPGANDLMGR